MFGLGTYGYTDSYGIYRQVEYVADKHGFRATVKTNEPGTANQSEINNTSFCQSSNIVMFYCL